MSLLSLLPGSAQLLKEVLSASTQSMAEQDLVEAVRALGEVGVHVLSPQQAKQILQLRIYSN